MLSLGGGYPTNQWIASNASAVRFADFLWGAFGPVTTAWTKDDKPRPFGTAVVDGFDFDIESQISPPPTYNGAAVDNYKTRGYGKMIETLKNTLFPSDKSKSYYLSAAPQCTIPDAHFAHLATAAWFDFMFVQFYNTASCSARAGVNHIEGASSVDMTYTGWADINYYNPNTRVYIGLPASTVASESYDYYLPADEANTLIKHYYSNKRFGGIMLWEATASANNIICAKNYATWIKKILQAVATGKTINTDTDDCPDGETDCGSCPTTPKSIAGRCGPNFGMTCSGSAFGQCCSADGYCSSSYAVCSQTCDSRFTNCSAAAKVKKPTTTIKKTTAKKTTTMSTTSSKHTSTTSKHTTTSSKRTTTSSKSTATSVKPTSETTSKTSTKTMSTSHTTSKSSSSVRYVSPLSTTTMRSNSTRRVKRDMVDLPRRQATSSLVVTSSALWPNSSINGLVQAQSVAGSSSSSSASFSASSSSSSTSATQVSSSSTSAAQVAPSVAAAVQAASSSSSAVQAASSSSSAAQVVTSSGSEVQANSTSSTTSQIIASVFAAAQIASSSAGTTQNATSTTTQAAHIPLYTGAALNGSANYQNFTGAAANQVITTTIYSTEIITITELYTTMTVTSLIPVATVTEAAGFAQASASPVTDTITKTIYETFTTCLGSVADCASHPESQTVTTVTEIIDVYTTVIPAEDVAVTTIHTTDTVYSTDYVTVTRGSSSDLTTVTSTSTYAIYTTVVVLRNSASATATPTAFADKANGKSGGKAAANDDTDSTTKTTIFSTVTFFETVSVQPNGQVVTMTVSPIPLANNNGGAGYAAPTIASGYRNAIAGARPTNGTGIYRAIEQPSGAAVAVDAVHSGHAAAELAYKFEMSDKALTNSANGGSEVNVLMGVVVGVVVGALVMF